MTVQEDYTQSEVANWFDQTYATKGFRYLRPLESYPIFLQLLEAKPGRRLLDIACGPGLLLRAARMRGLQPCGIDISHHALGMARTYADAAGVAEANAERLPFADQSFDYITCIGAIERFFDRDGALREFHRVAKPDAQFCFMVRNATTLTWKVWRTWLGKQNQKGHQDAKTLEDWHVLLQNCGYTVEGVYMDQWFRQKLRKVGRMMRRHDFTRPEPIAKPILPLRYANEFIFILRKAP